MKTETELLPCPFCGGEVAIAYRSCAWEITCPRCEFVFPRAGCTTEKALMDAWNTRWNGTAIVRTKFEPLTDPEYHQQNPVFAMPYL